MRGAMRIDKRSERAILIVLVVGTCWTPALVLAQAAGGGPFSTGAMNFQSSLLTILAPIAVIGVMVIGVAAWFNKVSWGWAAAAAGGLVLVFGAPQIVAWVRGMAGV
jgi:type IV secretion system protein VirB2